MSNSSAVVELMDEIEKLRINDTSESIVNITNELDLKNESELETKEKSYSMMHTFAQFQRKWNVK